MRKLTFTSDFDDFIGRRIEHCHQEGVNDNPEYVKYTNRLSELHREIAKLLGPEKKCLIDEYESTDSSMEYWQLVRTYIAGLRDGIALLELLKKVS